MTPRPAPGSCRRPAGPASRHTTGWTAPGADAAPGTLRTSRFRAGIKNASRRISGASTAGCPAWVRVCTEGVTENLVAGIIAGALIVYLVYALIRPDKF
ncbi:K(+)-transporting ATPase subunit F [Oryzihumus sp.]